jgi:hypothetical protein
MVVRRATSTPLALPGMENAVFQSTGLLTNDSFIRLFISLP